MLLAAIIVLYLNYYNDFDPHLRPSAINERTEIWKTVTPFMTNNLLFGNGIGSYEIYRSRVLHSLSTHNYYLSVIFELGVIGLIIIFVFIFYIFKDLINIPKTELNTKTIGIAMLIVILIDAITGNSPFAQSVSLNSWILLGACIIYSKNCRNSIVVDK